MQEVPAGGHQEGEAYEHGLEWISLQPGFNVQNVLHVDVDHFAHEFTCSGGKDGPLLNIWIDDIHFQK